MAEDKKVKVLVDHLFRHEAGKMTAVLVRLFGLKQIEIAEDIVQETLFQALQRWSTGPLPENPGGWLMEVAKRKAINHLRRESNHQRIRNRIRDESTSPFEEVGEVFLEEEIRDSQLRMMFTCCHPDLAREAQVALTLKTLGGFSVREVAHALLAQEETVQKRMVRARKKFRDGVIRYEIPSGEALLPRLESVCLTLYLVFNEGYSSTHPEQLIRRDLCAEAIRLCRLITEAFPHDNPSKALLALMLLQSARFASRLDPDGAIILFRDQDRQTWDQELIREGVELLHSSLGPTMTPYHLEAGIAAEHCTATSFETTNWESIEKQYDLLMTLKPGPVVALNWAIILSHTKGADVALKELKKLEHAEKLNRYPLYFTALGECNQKLGNHEEAREHFQKAISLTQSALEKEVIARKIQ